MKANELRVSNLVISNNQKYRPDKFGKICVVTAIDTNRPKIEQYSGVSCTLYVFDDEYQDTFGQMIEFIQPIPLTPEWHIRFGAKRNGFNDFVYQVSDIKTISFSGDYVFMRDFDIDINAPGMTDNICTLWNNDIRKRSMYVHEWQNMWNIMTGTELTLTEKPTK